MGVNPQHFVDKIINVNFVHKGTLFTLPYIQKFANAGVLRLFVPYYQELLLHHYGYSSLCSVYSSDRSKANSDLISLSIPYFTSFDTAFTVCDIHYLDFNLITAKPLLRDLFVYQNTRRNIRTQEVYKIFRDNFLVLNQFLKQFDHVSINYGYDINDERHCPRQYASFKNPLSFYITLIADGSLEWYTRDGYAIQDRGSGNSMGSDSNIARDIRNYILFYTKGDFQVNDLPIGDEIYDDDHFTLQKDSYKSDFELIKGCQSYKDLPSVKHFP